MKIAQELETRCEQKCELCGAPGSLHILPVEPADSNDASRHIMICETCKEQIEHKDRMQPNHWRCLNDSMWSTVPAVQVMAWRMLHRLKAEAWPQDLLDMMYLDEDTLKWAQATGEDKEATELLIHKDSNGVPLENGDSVVLIKDLKVKGSSMVAKRGTAVRRISLVHDNHEHIEGKVEGQQIVILTKFVKKI